MCVLCAYLITSQYMVNPSDYAVKMINRGLEIWSTAPTAIVKPCVDDRHKYRVGMLNGEARALEVVD